MCAHLGTDQTIIKICHWDKTTISVPNVALLFIHVCFVHVSAGTNVWSIRGTIEPGCLHFFIDNSLPTEAPFCLGSAKHVCRLSHGHNIHGSNNSASFNTLMSSLWLFSSNDKLSCYQFAARNLILCNLFKGNVIYPKTCADWGRVRPVSTTHYHWVRTIMQSVNHQFTFFYWSAIITVFCEICKYAKKIAQQYLI